MTERDRIATVIAKAFGGYSDLEWPRLDARERRWLLDKGLTVVDALIAASEEIAMTTAAQARVLVRAMRDAAEYEEYSEAVEALEDLLS